MRILVFGNSGSGKSTLAGKLAMTHGLAHLDLDSIVWEPDKVAVRRDLEAVSRSLSTFLDLHGRWVIEGCYGELVEAASSHCTQLVFLNPGLQTCLEHNRRRPWEPRKYASKQAQDAMLENLQAWVADYYERKDQWSYHAHRRIFDAFAGPKAEHLAGGWDGELVQSTGHWHWVPYARQAAARPRRATDQTAPAAITEEANDRASHTRSLRPLSGGARGRMEGHRGRRAHADPHQPAPVRDRAVLRHHPQARADAARSFRPGMRGRAGRGQAGRAGAGAGIPPAGHPHLPAGCTADRRRRTSISMWCPGRKAATGASVRRSWRPSMAPVARAALHTILARMQSVWSGCGRLPGSLPKPSGDPCEPAWLAPGIWQCASRRGTLRSWAARSSLALMAPRGAA